MPLRFVTAPGGEASPFITGRGLTDAEYAVLEALRGPQHYIQATPDATAASATAAAIHTARDAAGAGTLGNPKIVRIPGGTVTGAVTMSLDYQVWELAEGTLTNGRPTASGSGATILQGKININGNGCGIRGGTWTGGTESWYGSGGNNFTATDVFIRDGEIAFRAKDNITFERFDAIHTTTASYWQFDATGNGYGDPAAFGTCGPVYLKHGIWVRTGGTNVSAIISHDAESYGYSARYSNIEVYNCRFEMGTTQAIGWFGLEFFSGWNHRAEYSEFSGGHVLLSWVRGYGHTYGYNWFKGEPAYIAIEGAGYNSLTDVTGGTEPPQVGTFGEYNRITGAIYFVDSNNGPYGIGLAHNYKDGFGSLITRDTRTPTPANCIGGDNVVTDNTILNTATITNSYLDVADHPSTFSNNDADGAGWTP